MLITPRILLPSARNSGQERNCARRSPPGPEPSGPRQSTSGDLALPRACRLRSLVCAPLACRCQPNFHGADEPIDYGHNEDYCRQAEPVSLPAANFAPSTQFLFTVHPLQELSPHTDAPFLTIHTSHYCTLCAFCTVPPPLPTHRRHLLSCRNRAAVPSLQLPARPPALRRRFNKGAR